MARGLPPMPLLLMPGLQEMSLPVLWPRCWGAATAETASRAADWRRGGGPRKAGAPGRRREQNSRAPCRHPVAVFMLSDSAPSGCKIGRKAPGPKPTRGAGSGRPRTQNLACRVSSWGYLNAVRLGGRVFKAGVCGHTRQCAASGAQALAGGRNAAGRISDTCRGHRASDPHGQMQTCSCCQVAAGCVKLAGRPAVV